MALGQCRKSIKSNRIVNREMILKSFDIKRSPTCWQRRLTQHEMVRGELRGYTRAGMDKGNLCK